jgi:DNA-directed RNA polymerase subunit alpha
VLHEFSSIPGVKEDVTEIIMNIKELCIKNNSTSQEPKIAYIEASGNCVVTAADIKVDSDIEILNPDLVIANLSGPDAVLDMELTMAEKRDLIEWVTELVKNDILNKEDRDDIFRVCLAACSRELAKLNAAE